MDVFSVILVIVTGVGLTTFLLRLESWPSNRLAGPFPAGDTAWAMSEKNLELTRLGYEAFNRGDIDGFLDICTPDIEWQDIAAIDTAAVTGREAVRAFFVTATEPWEEIRREPEEIIELGGEHVLVLSHTTGRGKGSGIVVDARAADLCTIRGGRLVRWVAYPDRAQALEAAGLSE